MIGGPSRPSPTLAAAILLLAGCSRPPPLDCETSDEVACFTGVFSGLLGGRLEGVEVCAPELPEVACVTSDADGRWRLRGLPPDSDVLVTATYKDTVPTVFPQHTSMDWYEWYKVMVPESILNQHAKRTDVELDPSRGNLLFLVWEGLNIDGENTPNVPDVSASLSPMGDVFYANGLGLAAKDLTATSGSGSGGALNLDPGIYELTLDAPGGPCDEPSFSYLFEPGSPVRAPVIEGFTTAIDVICPGLD